MFNILIDILPTTVDIDEKEYLINTDFRTSILFELLLKSDEYSDEEKIFQGIQLYYPVIPDNIVKAVEKMFEFYSMSFLQNHSDKKGTGDIKPMEEIYSWDYDQMYIYSAFLNQYNIDLQEIEYLHWWKFKAMFLSLNEENKIVKIMGYRTVNTSKIKDKNQKEYYTKLKKQFAIPKSKYQQKINNQLAEALTNGDIKKIKELTKK